MVKQQTKTKQKPSSKVAGRGSVFVVINSSNQSEEVNDVSMSTSRVLRGNVFGNDP